MWLWNFLVFVWVIHPKIDSIQGQSAGKKYSNVKRERKEEAGENYIRRSVLICTRIHIGLSRFIESRRMSLPCKKRSLMTARISMLLKSRASPNMLLSTSITRNDLQFGTWTGLSFQRHYRFRTSTSGIRSG